MLMGMFTFARFDCYLTCHQVCGGDRNVYNNRVDCTADEICQEMASGGRCCILLGIRFLRRCGRRYSL